MSKKNLYEYKRKYQAFRHHAWAGLGFLSIFGVIRIVIPSFSVFLNPVLIVLIVYVFVSLLFTYKYQKGLSIEYENLRYSEELEKERLKTNIEKARLKLEEKKTKVQAKTQKKMKEK
ncbi:hypothetical protein MBGDN05_00746 [Thermoplasmatales archaeon SCGC AB-539-N05]|nr:hypothetical protein MBGDN05_00746 [Thermoplasmatales archaeon SCGC AB-539-N05]